MQAELHLNLRRFTLILVLILSFISTYGQPTFTKQPDDYVSDHGLNTSDYKAWTYTRVVNGAYQNIPFRLLHPMGYDPNNTDKKYPLIIMLHGNGEKGNDNTKQLMHGAKEHLAAVRNAANPSYMGNQKFEGFVLFPQEPYGSWTAGPNYTDNQVTTALSQVFDIIEWLKSQYRIDPDRVVIHGLSSGGTGTWASLYHRPDLFAGALPMSAPGDLSQMGKIATIPIWLFQGGKDTNPPPFDSEKVIKALRDAGAINPDVTKYTEYPTIGHDVWNTAYAEPDFFPYILRQNRKQLKVLGRNPRCPGENITLGINAGFFSYQWYQKPEGATTFSIVPGNNTFKLSNVPNGDYYVKFVIKQGEAEQTSNIITISDDPSAIKPVITANESLILPSPTASSVTLSGPSNYDIYDWSHGSDSRNVNVTISGSYSLRVKKSFGCWTPFSDPVIVKVGQSDGGLAMPTGFVATPVSSTSVRLTWTNNEATATGNEIYRSIKPNEGYQFIKLLKGNETTFTDEQLTPSTGYYYIIRVVNTNAATTCIDKAFTETFKDVQAPSIPDGLSLVSLGSDEQLTLKWNVAQDNTQIKKYRVYNGDELIGETSTNSFSFKISPKNYMFNVEAIDYSGNSSGKSSYFPFSYNGHGLSVSYYIRKNNSAWTTLPNFSQLTPDGIYWVQKPYMIPSSSSEVGVVTEELTKTNIITTKDYYALKYSGYIKFTSQGTYTFYGATDDGMVMKINNNTNAVINRNQAQGNDTWHPGNFEVEAAMVNKWLPFSLEYFEVGGGQAIELKWRPPGKPTAEEIPVENFALSTSPSTPINVTLNTANYDRLLLSDPNKGVTGGVDKIKVKVQIKFTSAPSSTVKFFELFRGKTTGAGTTATTFKKIAEIPRAGNNKDIFYTDTVGLEANSYYNYYIKIYGESSFTAYHIPGGLKTPTNIETVEHFTDQQQLSVPTLAPLITNAKGETNTTILLSFSGSNSVRSGFEIFKSQDNINFALIGTVPANATSFSDNSGLNNTIYYYKIREFTQGGFSPFSNVVSASTKNKPNAPTNLKVETQGLNKVSLSWENNSINSGEGFKIYRSEDNSNFSAIATIPDPSLTTYLDNSITFDKPFYYKITAYYGSDESDFSNIATSVKFEAPKPELGDWKMPIQDVRHNFKSLSGNEYANTNYNRTKLKEALVGKRDFLRYLYIPKNDEAYFELKLPATLEHGGMITFNAMVIEKDYPDSTVVPDLPFEFTAPWNSNYNYYTVELSISGDGVNYTPLPTPWISNYHNRLEKIDVTNDMVGKWVRVKLASRTNRANYGGLLVTEIGAYRFLGPGKRHNYFILAGASVEKTNFPMGLIQFRKRLAVSNLSTEGQNAVIFNLSEGGKDSKDLSEKIQNIVNKHPYASYVMVHQGGNDINSSSNNLRPLSYEKLQTNTGVKNFISNFEHIINTIKSSGKVPLISRMHYRDYHDYCPGSNPPSTGGKLWNGPGVFGGRNQENGSLPFNLILDSLTKLHTPYAYNEDEKRSHVNFYPITLNYQEILSHYDGVHPKADAMGGGFNYYNKYIDYITDYWINYAMRYAYTGQFASPIPYDPDNQIGTPDLYCGMSPANKPNLISLTEAAVAKAKRTKAGADIWEARILVEQLKDKNQRVSFVLMLDSLKHFNSPQAPLNLALTVLDGTSLSLTWLDVNSRETGYEIFISTDGGNKFSLLKTETSNVSQSTITNLIENTTYHFYVRAANDKYKSAWSNIVSGRPNGTYYSKSTGDLNNINSWGKNSDGSGDSPTAFTENNHVYYVSNRPEEISLTTPFSIGGTNSKLVLTPGTKLTVEASSNLTGKIELQANSHLTLNTSTIPDIVSIDKTATLTFASGASLVNEQYGKLQLTTTGVKTFTNSVVEINGDLILSSNITLKGNPTILKVDGDLIFADNLPKLENIAIEFRKSTHNIDAKGGTIELTSLTYPASSTITVLNGSKIKLGSASGGGLLPEENSTLILNNGTLEIIGNGALNPFNKADAQISSSNSTININTTANLDSYLNLVNTNCDVKDLIFYNHSGKALVLVDSVYLTNILKLGNGILKTNDTLTLASTLYGTAKIAKVESGASIEGKIKWQRIVGPNKSQNQFFLGFPLKGLEVGALSRLITVKGFINTEVPTVSYLNEPTAKWIGLRDPKDILEVGKGYRTFIENKDFKFADNSAFLHLKGEPVVGDGQGNSAGSIILPLSSSHNGWNLISNPYPSEINWDSPALTKTNVRNCIYMWDGKNRSYKIYCGPGGGAGPTSTEGTTSIINAGQAFMVYATGTGSSVSLSEDVKIDGIQPPFYRSEAEQQIRIKLRNDKFVKDEAVLRFFGEATTAFDYDYDALKFNGSSLNLAILSQGDRLAISTIPYAASTTVVPLHVQSYSGGTFNLDVTETEMFNPAAEIYLHDKETGEIIDVRKQNTYAFNTTAAFDSKTRFELIFKNLPGDLVMANESNPHHTQSIQVFPNPVEKEATFSLHLRKEGNIKLEIFSTQGTIVHSGHKKGHIGTNNLEWHLGHKHFPAGIYYYSIKVDEEEFKGKLVVQ